MRQLKSAGLGLWPPLAKLLPLALWAALWLGVSPGSLSGILSPTSPADFLQGLSGILPFAAAFAAGVVIIFKLSQRLPRGFQVFSPLTLAAIYGVIGLIAASKSPSGAVALRWAALYLTVPLVLWAIVWGTDPLGQARRILNSTWLAIILVSIALFATALIYLDLKDVILDPSRLLECKSGNWLGLTSGHLRSTGVGRYAAVAAIIAISGLWQARWRPVWFFVLLSSIVLLLSSGARGSFAGFAVGAALTVLLYAGRRALFAGALALAVLVPTFWATGAHRTFLKGCVVGTFQVGSPLSASMVNQLSPAQQQQVLAQGQILSDSKALFRRATVEFNLARYQRAVDYASQAIQLSPYYSEAYALRGDVYRELGQPQWAQDDYILAQRTRYLLGDVNERLAVITSLGAQNYGDYYIRGLSRLSIGQYEGALQDFDQVISLKPVEYLAYVNRGLAYSGLGQYERAIEDYTEAIEGSGGNLYPGSPQFFKNFFSRGLAYFNLGRYDSAITDLSLAIGEFPHPDRAEAFIIRGIAYGELGRAELATQDLAQNEAAIEDLGPGFRLNPQAANVYYARGLAYFHLGQYQRAITFFDEATRLDPRDAAAYAKRGTAYGALGQQDRAIQDLDLATGLDSQDSAERSGSLDGQTDVSPQQQIVPQVSESETSSNDRQLPADSSAPKQTPSESSANDQQLPADPSAPKQTPSQSSTTQAPSVGRQPMPDAPGQQQADLSVSTVEPAALGSEGSQGSLRRFAKFTGRTAVWAEGLKLFRDSPFLGFGFHADRLILGTHMHNAFLHSLLQTGIMGAIPFMGALIFGWVLLFRTARKLAQFPLSHKHLVIQSGGILAFLTMRSFPESTGAFFGIDWLILAPILLYLHLVNSSLRSMDSTAR
jgi:tetratricopeptide (TPR) repeat protein